MVWLIVLFGLLVVLGIALWRRERNSRGYPDAPLRGPEPPTQPPTGGIY